MTAPLPGARTDPDVVRAFARDESSLLDAGTPRAVVSPANVAEVREVMRWASAERVPVLVRGAGTGLSGGALAVAGCVVLSTDRLTAVRELDPNDRVAVVEAGVVNAALNEQARAFGLMWAPDPSSWATSTVGGNVSTNAGGLRCLRYGATRANVLGLEVVLADGRVLNTGGRTVKRSAGYDLTQLLVGSEGTLAVVTAVVAKLLPLPPPQVTALATFGSTVDAAAAATAVMRSGCTATLLELIDAATVAAVDAFRGTGFGESVGAVLVAQVDDVAATAGLLDGVLREHGAVDVMTTADEAEGRELLDVRRAAYPAMQRIGRVLVEDVAVPVSRLAELIAAAETAAADHGLLIATVAHAGDGNAHPLLVVPPGADGEQRAWAAADAVFAAAQRLGGTVSGEHGIGRLKKRWLAQEVGETSLDVQRGLKNVFDPLNILNPGAVL
ncbi:MAG: glycolate oxidase [Frankiaceae bacterium]|nr:glycolate oxidase [Frankiaceae bacterium]